MEQMEQETQNDQETQNEQERPSKKYKLNEVINITHLQRPINIYKCYLQSFDFEQAFNNEFKYNIYFDGLYTIYKNTYEEAMEELNECKINLNIKQKTRLLHVGSVCKFILNLERHIANYVIEKRIRNESGKHDKYVAYDTQTWSVPKHLVIGSAELSWDKSTGRIVTVYILGASIEEITEESLYIYKAFSETALKIKDDEEIKVTNNYDLL